MTSRTLALAALLGALLAVSPAWAEHKAGAPPEGQPTLETPGTEHFMDFTLKLGQFSLGGIGTAVLTLAGHRECWLAPRAVYGDWLSARDHPRVTDDRRAIGVGNDDAPSGLDPCPNGRRRAEHDHGGDDREVRERRVNRLKHLLAGALGDDTANGAKDACEQGQILGAEMDGAVSDLAEKDREKWLRRVDRFHERLNQEIELLVRRRLLRRWRDANDAPESGRHDRYMDAKTLTHGIRSFGFRRRPNGTRCILNDKTAR